jgi:hypothetical protein
VFRLLERGMLKNTKDTIPSKMVIPFDDKLLNACRDEIDIDFV